MAESRSLSHACLFSLEAWWKARVSSQAKGNISFVTQSRGGKGSEHTQKVLSRKFKNSLCTSPVLV